MRHDQNSHNGWETIAEQISGSKDRHKSKRVGLQESVKDLSKKIKKLDKVTRTGYAIKPPNTNTSASGLIERT